VGGVVFAPLAALCNAVSVIARHIASTADPHRPTCRRLVGYLLRSPLWLAGWGAQAAACAGLAVFIVAAEPRGGNSGPTAGHWAVAIAACLAVVAVLSMLATGGSPGRRAALLGSATGVAWALEAAFIKSMTDDATEGGVVGLFTHWPVYAVAVGGAAGVLLEQAALQAGVVVMSLTAPATLQADERPDLTRPG
jgi:hypothetical protein